MDTEKKYSRNVSVFGIVLFPEISIYPIVSRIILNEALIEYFCKILRFSF